MSSETQISAKAIRAVLPCVASGDVRYYLNGIHAEPAEQGAVIVATDGHRLAAYHDTEAHVEQPLILSVDGDMARHLKGRGDPSLHIDSDGYAELRASRTYRGHRGGVIKGMPIYRSPCSVLIDGKFPNWRKVVPDAKSLRQGLHGTFNPHFLYGFIECLKGMGLKYYGLHFWQGAGEKSPSVLRCYDPAWVGVLMPMHDECLEPIPAFVRSAGEKSKAA